MKNGCKTNHCKKCKPKKRCGPITRQLCPCGRVMKNGCKTNHCKKCKPKKRCGPITRQFCQCGRVMKNGCKTNHCKKCKPRPKPILADGSRGRYMEKRRKKKNNRKRHRRGRHTEWGCSWNHNPWFPCS